MSDLVTDTVSTDTEIIVGITGGLGNQMFQYACAKALQVKYGVPVKLDIQQCQWHARRQYELDKFSISLPVATMQAISHFCSRPPSINKLNTLVWLAKKSEQKKCYRLLFRKILKKNALHPDIHLFTENPDSCDALKHLELPVYLDGYWQNADYFSSIEDEIRDDFTLKSMITGSVAAWSYKIQHYRCAVSVHIRRGDYLSRKVSSMFAVLPVDYYHAAMKRMSEAFGDVVFIIFSDDPEWVKQTFSDSSYAHEIVDGDHQGYEDMYLMSKCQHHIIANSTFSWWGAWLGGATNKQVVAPQQWGLSDKVKRITGGIIPPEWIRI